MRIIQSSNPFKAATAITVGKFEALHLGHIRLIEATVEYARSKNLAHAEEFTLSEEFAPFKEFALSKEFTHPKEFAPSKNLAPTVLSFTPHPAQVLSDKKYDPLFSSREQALLLAEYGIDYWIPYPFDKSVAQLTPKAFCQLLQTQFHCKALLVGEGFRFGYNREGTPQTLYTLGQQLGIEVITIPHSQFENEEKISTSQIRTYLAEGRIREANKLLGRPFLIIGTVLKGRQLGRTIGFPTANIHPADDKFLPPDGVYAAKITIKGQKKAGVTNIGINPTIISGQTRKVETHIFDFDTDIYGEEVLVELYAFIRPERTFSGIEELGKQIAADAREARKVLAANE